MIDILLAVYNGEKYIKAQLDSILGQTCEDWRLLIRDDGSKDNTLAIVNEYMSKYPEKIYLITDETNAGGAKYNFYQILKASTSDYIMLADQDDVWDKNKVQNAYNRIIQEEESVGKNKPVLCHGDLCVVDGNLNVINASMANMQKLDPQKNKLNDYLVQNNVTGCTVIFNKALRDMCRSMPKEAVMHDWWFALIASAFGKVCYMERAEILYRQHGNNTEGAKNLKNPIYLLKRLFNRKQIKKNLSKTYFQARAFYNEYENELNSSQKEIINAYISLEKSNKIRKYMIIKKYGFMKSGFARKLGYILFV